MVMKSSLVALLAVLSLVVLANADAKGCEFSLPIDVPRNEPVYLLKTNKNGFKIFEPTEKVNSLPVDSKVVLLCPGKKNTLSVEAVSEITCSKAHTFDVNPKSINCTKQVSGDLQITDRKCGAGNDMGIIYQAGFLVNPEFVALYEMCYNKDRASVIYTNHILNGKAIKYAVHESRRISFKIDAIPRPAKPENNFKTEAQIDRFNKQLGRYQKYFNKKMFLARGHMTPDADFIFPSGQFATYFYANVCPQFQAINGGNWLRVENLVRQIAADEDIGLDIYTGVYDRLRLIDERGEEQDIFLADNDLIEAPLWLWKVVENARTDQAIVFITLNNPFVAKQEIQEFCPNICADAGFVDKNFVNIKKGYTFCCSLAEFRKVVQVLPPNVKAKHLLRVKK